MSDLGVASPDNRLSPLRGTVALITGGARGIGAAICERLARDGSDVALTYSQSAVEAQRVVQAIEAYGARGAAIASDSSNVNANSAIAREVVDQLGRLDILVHNAGISIGHALGEYTSEDFDRVFAVNVRSVLLTSQAALPYMGEGGRIIIIGSAASERMPFSNTTLYTSSKSALVGLTKGMARDLGGRGITVNLVEPGPVDTDLNPADGAASQAHIDMMAIGRYGRPGEVAGLVAYLARPESGLITGARLPIDGGFSV